MNTWPLGVFASIDAGLGVSLDVARELGVPTCHLHAPSPASRTGERIAAFRDRLEQYGLQVTCVFAGFEGESYADIPTVSRTVGLAPIATRTTRAAELLEIAAFARELGVASVGLHIGFVPEEPNADYRELVALTQQLCHRLADAGQALHLETGQESAEVLERFLEDVAVANLFVNFDPANMILYGAGEPLPALRRVGRFVRSVHCKDATWSQEPGRTWGVEQPLGQGDVDFPAYLQTLAELGYNGALTIEREISQEPIRQRDEIAAAVNLLRGIKQALGR